MLLRRLYYLLSPRLRRTVRRIVFFPVDILDKVLGRRPPLVPPKGKIFTGQGDFMGIGDKFLDDFINTCHLKPDQHVLDVGCGIGRMARPLAFYLNTNGKYEGFDIVPEGVQWCKKHYASHHHFSFTHVQLDNDLYNLGSGLQANAFTFPYKDSSFDLVLLISVFTHMQADEVQQYLHEISRVMKPGGRCFATFFLMTRDAEERQHQLTKPFFPHGQGDVFLHDKRVKNANVAYSLTGVERMANEASLTIEQHHQGWWSGLPASSCKDFQDILVFSPFI